jgi:ribosomal protein L20A (L18A)
MLFLYKDKLKRDKIEIMQVQNIDKLRELASSFLSQYFVN